MRQLELQSLWRGYTWQQFVLYAVELPVKGPQPIGKGEAGFTESVRYETPVVVEAPSREQKLQERAYSWPCWQTTRQFIIHPE
jgi:hypothetical protein